MTKRGKKQIIKVNKLNGKFSLSNSDFIRHFCYYLAIILIFVAVAYLLAVLPSIFSKKSTEPSTPAFDFSNISTSAETFSSNEYSDVKCIASMTEGSKQYNVQYGILFNQTAVGTIDFKTIKQESGYLRTMTYVLNLSLLAKAQSANSSYSLESFSDSASEIKIYTFYDSDFNCKNASFSMLVEGKEQILSYECMPPDIPFRICKENLTEKARYTMNVIAGQFNVIEYELEDSQDANTRQLQNTTMTFSDLPFPITVAGGGMEFKLSRYSKIE